MIKRHLILFCIPLIALCIACKQTPEEHDSSWNISGDAYVTIDSSQVIEEKHPYCLQGTRDYANRMKPIVFRQAQLFEVPRSSKEIKISLNSMSEKVEKAILYAKIYNNAMSNILQDSSDIRSTSWTEKEFIIPAKNADFLVVVMKVEGDTAQLNSDNIQRMWFDTLRVTVDGKSLYASMPKEHKVRKKIDKDKIIPAGMDDFSGLEKRLKDKKIIGLGESIHGSKEFNRMSFDFIERSVFRGECKLILLEMPLYFSVRWELFVQGLIDEGEIEDIKREIVSGSAFGDEDEFAELLQLLREYNRIHNDKVHILGMDTYLLSLPVAIKDSARDLLAAFINKQNKEKILPILDFMDNEEWPHKLLAKIMENESFLKAEMGTPYFELAKSLITQYDILGIGSFDNRHVLSLYDYMRFRRDYHMWLNTQMLVDNFSKEGTVTIIKAHNGHLSKSEIGSWMHDIPALGYYIDQEYGDKYTSIALVAASGRHTGIIMGESFDNFEKELKYPLSGSIEKFCSDAGLDMFCYPAKDIPADIRLIRCVGQGKGLKEFLYDNLSKNNDYVLFLDKISPSRKKKDKDTKEEMEEKTDFMLYGLREKRDSIFQQKMTYWKSR